MSTSYDEPTTNELSQSAAKAAALVLRDWVAVAPTSAQTAAQVAEAAAALEAFATGDNIVQEE